MESSRDLQPLDPVAAGVAGLLDQIEGVQCWIKDREGRYAWVNRGFLLNYALERTEQVVGRTDHDLSPPHLADQYRLDDDHALGGGTVDGRIELVGRFDRTAVWSLTTKKPLPPGTRHGYVNIGSLTHHVPFIFGSLTLGGWGVFLDVDARPTEAGDLEALTVTAAELNGTVFLEREIATAAAARARLRCTLIPADRTRRDGTGGLELSLAAVVGEPLVLEAERFRAVSVVRGRGTLALAGEEAAIAPHDHFGIPADLPATITARGSEPLVLLDATLR